MGSFNQAHLAILLILLIPLGAIVYVLIGKNEPAEIKSDSEVFQISRDNNIKTPRLAALVIATAGLYFIIYLSHLERIFDKHCGSNLGKKKIVLSYMISWGWFAYFGQFGSAASAISFVLWLVSMSLLIYWSFTVKKLLEDYALFKVKTVLKLNAFYVVFLNVFYICYCLNDLEEVKKRNDYAVNMQRSIAESNDSGEQKPG